MTPLLAVVQRDRGSFISAYGKRPYLPTLILEGDHMDKWPVIAIVDDDEWMRSSLERLLKAAGYRSEAFASAEHYLAACNREEIGFLILDIGLPGMNGFELQRFLAAECKRPPILFVSAHDEPEVRNESAHAGAVAFLGKPFDDKALLDAISRALK